MARMLHSALGTMHDDFDADTTDAMDQRDDEMYIERTIEEEMERYDGFFDADVDW